MAEIRVTCPTRQLLIAAIPVQFVDGEALVSEEVAEELRPYAAAHDLEFHAPAGEPAEAQPEAAPAGEPAEAQPEAAPAEESAESPTEESVETPKGRGKRAASPFGN